MNPASIAYVLVMTAEPATATAAFLQLLPDRLMQRLTASQPSRRLLYPAR